MIANSSYRKTFERNVDGRRYTVRYIEPSYDKEERKTKEREIVAKQLYDIFAKYYKNTNT